MPLQHLQQYLIALSQPLGLSTWTTMLLSSAVLGLLASAGLAGALPQIHSTSLEARASSADRLVFCHFMVRYATRPSS